MLSSTGVTWIQQGATGVGAGEVLNVSGRGRIMVQISGSFIGTVAFEATLDGENWRPVALLDLNSTSSALLTAVTGTGLYSSGNIGGLQCFRARVSSYISGSVSIAANASD